MSHTPTPWELAYLDKNGQRVIRGEHIEIATCWHHSVGSIEKEMEANAALIIKAVNAHDELVTALQQARERLRYDGDLFIDQGCHARAEASFMAMDACDNALAKVLQS